MIGTINEKQFHKEKAISALDRMKNAIDKDNLQDVDHHHEVANHHLDEVKYKSQQSANPKTIEDVIKKIDPNLVDEATNHIERNIEDPIATIASEVGQQVSREQAAQEDLSTTEIVQKATKQIADQMIQRIDVEKIVKKKSYVAATK